MHEQQQQMEPQQMQMHGHPQQMGMQQPQQVVLPHSQHQQMPMVQQMQMSHPHSQQMVSERQPTPQMMYAPPSSSVGVVSVPLQEHNEQVISKTWL
ncbi:unnamed protein product [Cylicostephanus goldi]|uniref:Uncharacterized protein n=1 Tax=Cylicostephanus goldi TaxID=71465 RepID=A0A3P7QTW1_CYLGO|nr:unnamed protein product [Cylicostephanus goldi]